MLYLALTSAPFWYLGLHGLPQGFEAVNPELINGLLAGSSILFGFAVLPFGERKTDFLLNLMIFFDVFILGISGFLIFRYAIGYRGDLNALLFVTASLNANVMTALYRHFLSATLSLPKSLSS